MAVKTKEYDGRDLVASIGASDLILKKNATSGTVEKLTKTTLSTQIQDDLMANTAVTTATPTTDKIVKVKADGTIETIDLQNLMIQMKGYKEYTFAIRQSGTDAPTISVIRDDFKLVTPLSFTRGSGNGNYNCDITSLGLTAGTGVNIVLSQTIKDLENGGVRYVMAILASNTVLNVKTASITANSYSGVDDVLTDKLGEVISIRETLT